MLRSFLNASLRLPALLALAACGGGGGGGGEPSAGAANSHAISPSTEEIDAPSATEDETVTSPATEEAGSPVTAETIDTSAVAGFWSASRYDFELLEFDERYVLISRDGRYTDYDYRQDDLADDGNCHRITTSEMTLVGQETWNFGSNPDASNLTDQEHLHGERLVSRYRLEDGREMQLVSGNSDLLWVITGSEGELDTWEAVAGQEPEDLEPCMN